MENSENSKDLSVDFQQTILNLRNLNGQSALSESRTHLNGKPGMLENDREKSNPQDSTKKTDSYSGDMGIFKKRNGSCDETTITLGESEKASSFVINDKMRSSIRDIMNKMSENTPTLGNLLAKTKYTGLDTKDTKSTILGNLSGQNNSTLGTSKVASVGNLFDKMQDIQNSTTTELKDIKNNAVLQSKSESEEKESEPDVIELDDSAEDVAPLSICDTNVQSETVKTNDIKLEEELLEIGSDSEDEQEESKTNAKDQEVQQVEEDKLLASDDDTQNSVQSDNKFCENSQDSIDAKGNDSEKESSKDSDNKNKICDNKSDRSEKMDVDEEGDGDDESSSASEDETESKPSNDSKVKSLSSEDSNSSSDSKCSRKSKTENVKEESDSTADPQERKRPADFGESFSSVEPKRSRLDLMIGKLGSQIGISPESLKNDEDMSDTDTATESTPTATSATEETDEEEDDTIKRKKKKRPIRLSEKALDKMVKTKVLNYLKSQKEGLLAELQQKVEQLQNSSDMWKHKAKDLEKQILDVTVLQQKHEKRKAKTAALRQITTKSIGVQVDVQKAAAMVQQAQQNTPTKPPPVSKTPAKVTSPVVQTPSVSKSGPSLTISSSSSPVLAPPRSTLNPVTNIPILTAISSQAQSKSTFVVTSSVSSSPSIASTSPNSKPSFPGNQTVKSILDNSRKSTTLNNLDNNLTMKNILERSVSLRPTAVSQPPPAYSTNHQIVPQFIVVPSTQHLTNISSTKPNVTMVAPVVNPPTQSKSVKVIDLTTEEEANRTTLASLKLPSNQSQVLVPSGSSLPQGLIFNTPNGTPLVRNAQQQAYQLVFTGNSSSQSIRQASILTLATPMQTAGVRTTGSVATISSPQVAAAVAQMPQLKPGQTVPVPASTRQQVPIITTQQNRPPPPLQLAAHNTSRTATTSLSTVAAPAHHPAPLPPVNHTAIQPGQKPLPPKPNLKISRVSQGIVLSWNMQLNETPHADIASYQLFAYQEGNTPPNTSLWKKVGDVKALPLPMACTLTQFQEGNKYHFAVRPVDVHGRNGPFSDPNTIHLLPNKKD